MTRSVKAIRKEMNKLSSKIEKLKDQLDDDTFRMEECFAELDSIYAEKVEGKPPVDKKFNELIRDLDVAWKAEDKKKKGGKRKR